MHETLGTSTDRYTLLSPLRSRPSRSLEDTARSIQATNTVARFPLQFRFRYSLYPRHHQYLRRPSFSLSPRQLPRSGGTECSLHLGYPSYSDPANQERVCRRQFFRSYLGKPRTISSLHDWKWSDIHG